MHTSLTYSSFKRNPWVISLIGTLYIFFEFMLINLPNAISMDLIAHYNLSGKQFGFLASAFFYANLVMLFPGGILLDRFSVKRLMITGLILALIGLLLFALRAPYEWLVFGRLITGIGGAFSFIGCMKLASLHLPPKRFGFISGFITLMAMLGGMMAQTPTTFLLESIGYVSTLYVYIVEGVIVLLVLLWILPRSKDRENFYHLPHTQLGWHEIATKLVKLLLYPRNWLCSIYSGGIHQVVFVLGGAWGIIYLQQTHDLTALQASYVTSMLFIGALCGAPLIGLLSDVWGKRRLPMRLFSFISVIFILILMFAEALSLSMMIVVFFLMGFNQAASALSYPLITEINSKQFTATACSLVSMGFIGFAALSQPMFGWLLDLNWDGTRVDGVAIYTLANYKLALSLLLGLSVLSFITSLFLWETHCKHQDELDEDKS